MAALLEFERSPSRTAADVENASFNRVYGLSLHRRPRVIRSEVVSGTAGREDEAIISLHDLLPATTLEMVQHRLADGILLALQDPPQVTR
jgi:hypothetical protein